MDNINKLYQQRMVKINYWKQGKEIVTVHKFHAEVGGPADAKNQVLYN